jgi:hypothetical protein
MRIYHSLMQEKANIAHSLENKNISNTEQDKAER